MWKINFEKKSSISHWEISIFCAMQESDNVQHLIFALLICPVVTLGRLKTKESFKLLSLKVVTVTYERCSHMRGSKYMYNDLTWKLLVYWKIGHRREEVTYERWSQLEVTLCCKAYGNARICIPAGLDTPRRSLYNTPWVKLLLWQGPLPTRVPYPTWTLHSQCPFPCQAESLLQQCLKTARQTSVQISNLEYYFAFWNL